jgi:hypothetical protein
MSINKLLVSAAFLLCAGAVIPAYAVGAPGGMSEETTVGAAMQQLYARNGADDGAAHNANDKRKGGEGAGHARNGADDGAGHNSNDRRRHGEGAGHARNGADDGAAHNANDKRKGGEGAGHA